VVKTAGDGTGGMTLIAGKAVICISSDIFMTIVHIRLIVGMAGDAGKSAVAPGVIMAIGT